MIPALKECYSCSSLQTRSIIVGCLWVIGGTSALLIIIPDGANTFMYDTMKGFKTGTIVYFLLLISLSVLMILGAIKKKWKLIVPWLVVQVICIFFLSNSLYFAMDFSSLGTVIYLFGGLLVIGLLIYLWATPLSYVIELTEKPSRRMYIQVPVVENK